MYNARFLKFFVIGGISTSVDFILFYLFHYILAYDVVITNIISYGIGIHVSFLLNRSWTFQDSLHKSYKNIYLALVFGYLGLILNTLIVKFLSMYLEPIYAKIPAVLIVLLYNYNVNKFVIFRVVN